MTLFNGVRGVVFPNQPLRRRAGHPHPPLHQLVGSQGIIEGTEIAHEFRKIYACSFLYDVDGIAYWPAVAVNYTNKTQFMFKINKGVESVFDSKMVNRYIPENERPVPFKHMIYVGDGTTDIPCMRLVKEFRRTLDRRLQPRPEGRAQGDGLADPRQPRGATSARPTTPRDRKWTCSSDHHRQDRPRRPARKNWRPSNSHVAAQTIERGFPDFPFRLLGGSPEWIAGMRLRPGSVAATVSAPHTLRLRALRRISGPRGRSGGMRALPSCEPLQLVLLPEQGAARFLARKVLAAWRNYFLFAVPYAAVIVLRHPDTCWMAAGWASLAALALLYAVVSKYARYQPDRTPPAGRWPPNWAPRDSSSPCCCR